LCQTAKTQFENILRLSFAQIKYVHQTLECLFGVVTATDQLNDFINIEYGEKESLDQVQTILPLSQSVLRPPGHNVNPVIEKDLEHFLQAQCLRAAVDERNGVDTKGIFKRGEPVEMLKNSFWPEPG